MIAPVHPVLFAHGGRRPAWHLLRQLLWSVALIGSLTSTVFLGMVLVAAVRYATSCRMPVQRVLGVPPRELPPVTILKPLYGMEPRLEANLESFFRQDYPNLRLSSARATARTKRSDVVDKLQANYPQVRTRIVLSGEPSWPNAKVFSLNNMIAACADDSYLVSATAMCWLAPTSCAM